MPNAQDSHAGLDAVIDEQLRVLGQLNASLLDEHAAIAARDVETLNRRSQEKLTALRSLSELEERRRSLAGDSGSAHRADELRRLTEQCRAQNGANEALLRAERRFVEGLLSILRSGTLASNTYDRSADLARSGARRLPLASA